MELNTTELKALRIACKNSNLELFNLFYDQLIVTNENSNYFLNLTISAGYNTTKTQDKYEIVSILIKNMTAAEINKVDKNNYTALHKAIDYKCYEIALLLLDYTTGDDIVKIYPNKLYQGCINEDVIFMIYKNKYSGCDYNENEYCFVNNCIHSKIIDRMSIDNLINYITPFNNPYNIFEIFISFRCKKSFELLLSKLDNSIILENYTRIIKMFIYNDINSLLDFIIYKKELIYAIDDAIIDIFSQDYFSISGNIIEGIKLLFQHIYDFDSFKDNFFLSDKFSKIIYKKEILELLTNYFTNDFIQQILDENYDTWKDNLTENKNKYDKLFLYIISNSVFDSRLVIFLSLKPKKYNKLIVTMLKRTKDEQIFNTLIDYVDINDILNKNWQTKINWIEKKEIFPLFLEKIKNIKFDNPHIAVLNYNIESLDTFGAEQFSIYDENGLTALHMAINMKQIEIIKKLVSNMSLNQLNKKDKEDNTALDLVCQMQDIELISFFLKTIKTKKNY